VNAALHLRRDLPCPALVQSVLFAGVLKRAAAGNPSETWIRNNLITAMNLAHKVLFQW